MTNAQEPPVFTPPWGNTAIEGTAAEPEFVPLALPPGVTHFGPGTGEVTLQESDLPPTADEMNEPPPDQQVFNDNAFRQMMAGEGLGRKKDVVIPDAALQRNPFKPPPKPVKPRNLDPVHLGQIPRPESTPLWSTFAQFIMKHGDVIIAAKYPHPYGEVVDTMWRGVPVTHDDQVTEVRHVTAGWIGWDLAKDDE